MKNNNMMMWALGAVVAWWLFSRGTLDPYLDPIIDPLSASFKEIFPGDTVLVDGNGEVVVVSENGEVVSGNGNGVVNGNGVSGITDWGDIYA